MRLTAATVAAILAAMPAAAIAQCEVGVELSTCERNLYDAAIVWEGRARETRIRAENCDEKLAIVRTSTTITAITVIPPPLSSPDLGEFVLYFAGSALGGFLIGTLAAIVMVK